MTTAAAKPLIILADDDVELLKAMQFRLQQWGYRIKCVPDKARLLELLSVEEPILLLLDLFFGEHDGVELLQDLLRQRPGLTVVLFTAHGSIDSAVTAIKHGAYDYLTKPIDLNRLRVVIGHAVEKRELNQRVQRLEQVVANQGVNQLLWGESSAMVQMREMVASVAATDATVLIVGESGTGKELVARSLHEQSTRAGGPFVPVNMAALPHELVESTLFGHEKGSFTGADQAQIGCCEAANHGTLFLDEIGEMDLGLQAKLLRFLQEHTIQRVGSSKTVTVDVRVLAATNRDLSERVKANQFREDLYYRLHVVPVQLPPLRNRLGDVPLLASRFLQRAAVRHHKNVTGFTEEALSALGSYDWPGNVRQLENLVERMVILSRGGEVGREALPAEVLEQASPRAAATTTTVTRPDSKPAEGLRMIDQMEKQTIVDALHRAQGNVREAARLLGLGQATVYRKIKRYGIVLEDRGREPVEGAGTPGG